MSQPQSIRSNTLWKFRGLDEDKRFRVIKVTRGKNGSVQYVTDGANEEPTKRPRADFLAHFDFIA